MSSSGPAHLSGETLQRAATLCRNAIAASLEIGEARFPSTHDYIVFLLTNETETIVLYCGPMGYLVESYIEDESGEFTSTYYFPKNIRHEIFRLRREGFTAWTISNQDIIDALDDGEIDLDNFFEEE